MGGGAIIFNYREYLTAVTAVFLALALGILIGVSFGDSVLVANQRDVIQLMEAKLGRLREDKQLRERELQRWELLKPSIRRYFDGALAGKILLLLCADGQEHRALLSLLEEAGAAATLLSLPGPQEAAEGEKGEREAAEELAALLAKCGENLAGGLVERTLLSPGAGASLPPESPDCFLLLLEGIEPDSGAYYRALRRGLRERGARVIILCPWSEREEGETPPVSAPEEEDVDFVDNIDTFWGQMALLKMIAEDISGHYGFGASGDGLLPGRVEEGACGD